MRFFTLIVTYINRKRYYLKRGHEMDFFYALFFIIVFLCLLFVLVIVTKFIGGKAKKAMKGQYISIIETVSLGMDKKIHLIKADNQFVLIATTSKNIEYLTNINIQDYEDKDSLNVNDTFDFKKIFDKYIQNFRNNKGNTNLKKKAGNDISNDLGNFAEGDIFKNNLDKLRNITNRVNMSVKTDGDENINEK
jgi:flagellar protein FliO/FliZ